MNPITQVSKIKKVALGTAFTLTLAISGTALAGPKCTEGRTADWINADEMQQRIVDMGYKIKKFKESRGHCYEIYGWNQAGQKVEVYFHPVTGNIMKQEIED